MVCVQRVQVYIDIYWINKNSNNNIMNIPQIQPDEKNNNNEFSDNENSKNK